jgi:hypothetical protein
VPSIPRSVYMSLTFACSLLSCSPDRQPPKPLMANMVATYSCVWARDIVAWLVSILAFLGMLASPSFAQHQALTLPRALDQLTGEAALIVRGDVISTKIEPHPQLKNLTTMVVTMHVTETYKGAAQKTLVFRQYIWDLRAQLDAADYRKGQELLLLLGPVSKYGLTSPVGLEQGRFRILRDQKGREVAVNGRGNLGLFNSVEQRASARGIQLSPKTLALARRPKAGPIPLSDLEDAIRTFMRAR